MVGLFGGEVYIVRRRCTGFVEWSRCVKKKRVRVSVDPIWPIEDLRRYYK